MIPAASNGVIIGRLARNADPAGTVDQTGNGRLNLSRALGDTSTVAVQPAGAAPTGSGGPFVGPYVVAAVENLQGWGNSSTNWFGTLNGTNSSYKEGESIPVRYSNTLAAGSTHTIVLKYDFLSGGTHFADHLTTVDRTIALTTAQICAGLASCSGAPTTEPIPIDTSNPLGAQFTSQELRAWNISSMTVNSSNYIGSPRSITVAFTVAGTTGNKDVAIAYSLHLARENEWGAGSGARNYPGGSGKAFSSLDGAADKNVSVNPSQAIAAAAVIRGTVYDDLNGDGNFDAGEPGMPGVSVQLSGTATTTALTQADGSYSFSGLNAGTYNVTYRCRLAMSTLAPPHTPASP